MKNRLLIFLCIVITLFTFSCHSAKQPEVVASFYPLYLMAANLLQGLPYEVAFIDAGEGGCAHDYALTPTDRMLVERAKVVVSMGDGFDSFLDGIRHAKPNQFWISASAFISTDQKIYHETDHQHDHQHDHDGCTTCSSHSTNHVNNHFFASPRLYLSMAKGVARELSSFVKFDEVERLESNLDAYEVQLRALMGEVDALRAMVDGMTVLSQHSAFDYLANDLGLSIIGVLQESEEENLSSAKLMELSSLIAEKDCKAVLGEIGFSDRIPNLLKKETGISVLWLDSVASASKEMRRNDYELRMRANIDLIRSLVK